MLQPVSQSQQRNSTARCVLGLNIFLSFNDSRSSHELVPTIVGTDSSVFCNWDQSMEDLMDGGRQYYEDVALPKLVRDPIQIFRCWL